MEIIKFNYDNPNPILEKVKELEYLLANEDFPVFLYGGTLLGCVRDNDLIPYDDDIDVFYISKQTHRKAVLNEFENVIRPLLENEGWEINPISWKYNLSPHLMMGQFHIVKDNISLDVWTAWFNENDNFNVTMTVEKKFTKDELLPPIQMKLRNFDFNVPKNYETFLEHLYGENWQTPDSKYKIPSNKNFLQKHILKIIDQFGWAYYFIAKDQQKYSYHQIDYKRIADIQNNLINNDIIYFHSPGLGLPQIESILNSGQLSKHTKIIGAYGGEHPGKYSKADLILTISFPYLYQLKERYPDKPCIFLPEAIDTEYFNTKRYKRKSFTVGYVGRPCKVKRMHLLNELDYEVKTMTDWGKDHFVDGRTLDNVRDFYKSIDCLVLTSQSECMPRVVLEAMAMGLPVVSTDVGCLRMLLEQEWIVPNSSEEDIVKNINDRLKILEKYPQIKKDVGKRNRKYVVNNFSWETIQPIWDDVFNALVVNDIEKINTIGNELEERWNPFYKDFICKKRTDLNKKDEQKIPEIKNIKSQVLSILSNEILLKNTCKEAVINHSLEEKEFFLGGCDNDLNRIRAKLTSYSFKETDLNVFVKQDYTITLLSYTGKTKSYGTEGISFKVPLPVVGYLQNLYGNNWNLTKEK